MPVNRDGLTKPLVRPEPLWEGGVQLSCGINQHLFWRRRHLPIRLRAIMQRIQRTTVSSRCTHRSGQSTLDYVLILATMLPVVAFIITKGKKMMALVWEMFSVQVSWPFM